MGPLHETVHGGPRIVGGLTAGLAYATLVSFTHPFTWAADVVTALPLLVVAAVTVRTRPPIRRRRHRAATGSGARPRPGSSSRALVWLAPLVAVTGWELYCFVSTPRVEHPTLSSLIDLLDATRPGKFVAGAAWLGLGWFLVSR